MNKAFKVLWNQVRGTYVVASEAQVTHGKPGKATKTIVAAAVAGLLAMGGVAQAGEINVTVEYTENLGTSKFISGNGETLNLNTNASIAKLLADLQAADKADLKSVLEAIGQHTWGGTTTLIGVAGGSNLMDKNAHQLLGAIGSPDAAEGSLEYYVNKLVPQFNQSGIEDTFNKDTTINVGSIKTEESEGYEPVVMGLIGTDILLNTGLQPLFEGAEPVKDLTLERTGTSTINFNSGNTILSFGAGAAINLNLTKSAEEPGLGAVAAAPSTNSKLNGSTKLNIQGGANVLGAFGAGSAVALGGKATSVVTGGSEITVNSTVNSDQIEGVSVGLVGAGLSVSTFGGNSETSINTTHITLDNGITLGTIGGGISLVTDPSLVTSLLPSGIADLANALLPTDGGTATSKVSEATQIDATSTSALLMGGGIAVANSDQGSSKAEAISGTIVINLNGAADVSKDIFHDTDDKQTNRLKFHQDAKAFYDFGQAVFTQLTTDAPFDVQGLISGLKDSVKNLNYSGVHVGNLGAGIAVARGNDTSAEASANATDVYLNMNGGYNIANLAGGVALGVGGELSKDSLVKATTSANSTNVTVSAGESILIAGGGAAFATADKGYETEVTAQSHVETANITVKGGLAEGVYGGGIAIDDTNSSRTNATASTGTNNITVEGGTVQRANLSIIPSFAIGEVNGNPSKGALVNDTADLIAKGDVAILGGGMATGAKATANTTNVNIQLLGGTVNGSVFASGAATFGGISDVENAEITVDGATVNGDIYAAGLAGSKRSSEANTQYQEALSTVGDTVITLRSGELNGNIYANGFVYENNEKADSHVQNLQVNLESASVFKGKVISGQEAVETAALNFAGDSYDMKDVSVIGFNTIDAKAATVSNLSYDFGGREDTVVTGGPVEFVSFGEAQGKTLVVGNDAGETKVAGFASVAKDVNIGGMTFSVDTGLLSFNETGANALEIAAAAPAQAVATVYMTGDVDLANATVLVGETDSEETGLYMGANGLLIADAAAKTSVAGTADTAEGAIHFVGVAEDGATVKIAADEETATTVDNVLYKSVWDKTGYTFEARTGDELAEVGLGDFDATDMLADLHNHDNKGARFIERFLDQATVGVTNENRTQQLNAAVNLATAAGVQTAAIDSASLGIDAANKRASIINDQHEGGVLFAEASGRRTEMGGSADFGAIKSELGGVVVGGEYTTGDWTFGALANVGTGSVKGEGDNAGVDNDVDYYGAQIYTGKRFGQFNVVGQVGYLATSNEISHSTVALNKADVDADVITVGVRGEMRFDVTENTRMVPYIGLNYLRVGTDGYTTSQGVQVGDVDQNLFTLPVGVKYAGDMETTSGWMWTPSVDVAYVAAFGDRDVEATTHVGAVGQTTMDVWAESVVRTTIGVKAQKDNFGFGVEAGGAFGSDDTQGLFGQVRVDYRF